MATASQNSTRCIVRRSARIPFSVTTPLQLEGRLLVLFDGHCGLCNRAVRWFLRRDRHDRLRFAPSSSPLVQPLIAPLLAQLIPSADALAPSTILVLRNPGQPTSQQLLIRSAAVLAMLAQLPAPWPAVARTLRLVPHPLRDLVYRLIARIRYRIWGRYDTCPLPTSAERAHFL
ncbi:MAG TPA: DCC1-like thiol-disulfide oxidoreductase family protein [Terracidiphilus sp.]|nr:DCC1-like thiol-disulfide oxidoreductase family protein [Terracidiphilus sp.]